MNEVIAIKDGVQYIEGWAGFAEKAGLIPQGTTTYQAMAIVQAGKEMGLQPLQSLRTMNFIKGRLVMSVQLQLALAKNTKDVVVESMEESDDYCKVTLRRKEEFITCEYTLDDAKKAGLIKPDGNWTKYQRQMLRWRAIGDALRIICPDLVMGLLSPEEAESIETFAPSVQKGRPEVSTPQAKSQAGKTPAGDAAKPSSSKVKEELKKELAEYCRGVVEYQAEILKEISFFEKDGKEYFITDIDNPKISEKWAGAALGNLRKRIKEEQEINKAVAEDGKGLNG